jgi:hypothetical protein
MKILALDRPRPDATLEKYQPHLRDEVRHTWESYRKGVIRDIYFRQDRPGVAIVLECDDTAEARNVLATFPLVKAGLIDFEVIPLGPFTNWELLFAPAGTSSAGATRVKDN